MRSFLLLSKITSETSIIMRVIVMYSIIEMLIEMVSLPPYLYILVYSHTLVMHISYSILLNDDT